MDATVILMDGILQVLTPDQSFEHVLELVNVNCGNPTREVSEDEDGNVEEGPGENSLVLVILLSGSDYLYFQNGKV
ncbi:hypothetical protein [Pseudomonas vranovensis]|uniref:Uncharacterized protein n=1 Tax=Pseudomonas vranovensis TaxID=321661 RepID=A0A423DUM9_9PSED|nr:hypothetical protein [Pseudomonas vranovensis]ROL75685.1 hypothetical protein BHU25_08080 [Pseudomonas vranovensis]